MPGLYEKIARNRNRILTGEIGAVLHDLGKMHPDFVLKQSRENDNRQKYHEHTAIDEFVDPELVDIFKSLVIEEEEGERLAVYDIITKHHRSNKAKGFLLKAFVKCDRKDSADDKGIVRKKQSRDGTFISSPFGYPKEKIDFYKLAGMFAELQENLKGYLINWHKSGSSCRWGGFRKDFLQFLEAYFSHAPGETRIPANDVTLWDHSYTAASLFKSSLVQKILEPGISERDIRWRIFGVFWNGSGFINRGRKVADIKARIRVIEAVKEKLREKLEVEVPLGNAVYEDLNGMCFTFPGLGEEKACELARACAKEALDIIMEESGFELWPFFTLSREGETLLFISEELNYARNYLELPALTPRLFISDGSSAERKAEPLSGSRDIFTAGIGGEICPQCRIRVRKGNEEACEVCGERTRGRLAEWLENREDTIWVTEAADANNRIALISFGFNLDRWLDGSMLGTLYSQTLKDLMEEGKGLKYRIKDGYAGYAGAVSYIHETLKFVIANRDNEGEDGEKAAEILSGFFEDVRIGKQNLAETLDNLESKVQPLAFNEKSLAAFLLTQNPSPARLYRIWKETAEFFDLVVKELKESIYYHKWERLKFNIKDASGAAGCLNLAGCLRRGPFIIKSDLLMPDTLLVFYDGEGCFYTIESLEKFRHGEHKGAEAVKNALKKGFAYLASEEDPQKNLLEGKNLFKGNIEFDFSRDSCELYYPFIQLDRSPVQFRLLVPARDAMDIIEKVYKLYAVRFEKVAGKLPFNVKLLVTGRKFPLYVLLDAEKRMLNKNDFGKDRSLYPWWDITGMRTDSYYGFYPVRCCSDENRYMGYMLDELQPLSAGKKFCLYPGYFDFEYLGGNADRYRICYKGIKRGDKIYEMLSGRPYYSFQIPELCCLWDILSSCFSRRQIAFIEEMLMEKVKRWEMVEEKGKKEVLEKMARAVLKDAGGASWKVLEEEKKDWLVKSAVNGMLFDAVVLFKHILKI